MTKRIHAINKAPTNACISIAVSFFLFLLLSLSCYSQTSEETEGVFTLKGITKLANGNPDPGVAMELRLGNQSIEKITSSKNGKYSVRMGISTSNPANEYTLFITKPGTVPKTLIINTYIPLNEFSLNSFSDYDFDLEIVMLTTNIKDIILERPSGKIKWSSSQNNFALDQVYAKVIQKEEEQLKKNPDKYLTELSEKKKKAEDEEKLKSKEEEILKAKKSEEEAKLKAEEEEKAKALAQQKTKEAEDEAIRQSLESMKQEMKKWRMQDSLDSVAILASKLTITIEKTSTPLSKKDIDVSTFIGTNAYSISIAKKSLKVSQEKINKTKAYNLAAKYETNNTLTSLLDVVDEYDKKMKKQ